VNNDPIIEMQEIVRRSHKVHVIGSRTKTGFHQDLDSVAIISTQGLQGVVTYDPQEFVITVLSGTRVSEVIAVLAEQGQYLPFDPLLSNSAATIGGTVASNAAGSGRFRFGGIRDFLLGVRFIDGRGNCIRGGGQVVKNAAGFDYPKLMVGSQGKLGVIYELTFKVFPRPESFATIVSYFTDLKPALACLNQLASSAMDIEAIDLIPNMETGGGYVLAIRIGGIATALSSRLSRLQKWASADRLLRNDDDAKFWSDGSSLEWAQDTPLLKLPITPLAIPELEQILSRDKIVRRYSVGGNVAWIASQWNEPWPSNFGAAQVFLGRPNTTIKPPELGPFGIAIKRALDPEMKLV